jgi:tyrosine-protein phosphatase SIW14
VIQQVTESVYRGPRPDKATCDQLIEQDFTTIIDLESGIYDATHNDPYENVDWAACGIRVIRIPMSDFMPPTKSELCNIALLISHQEHYVGKVFVHCLTGKDRTGMAIGAYRMIYQKWTYQQAKAEIIQNGMHWWYKFIWLPVLRGL